MRIAHLDTGRTWRGGQAQVLLLMRELRVRGHEQILLAPPGPLLDRARAEGFECAAAMFATRFSVRRAPCRLTKARVVSSEDERDKASAAAACRRRASNRLRGL